MRPLYKTTIIIWTEYDPTGRIEIDSLAYEAMTGDAYCSRQDTAYVKDPSQDTFPPSYEFFACPYCGEIDCDPDNDAGCDESMANGFDQDIGGES